MKYETDYLLLQKQLKALTEGEQDVIANLANASAALHMNLKDVNWTGFYLVRDGALVLGPFQGKPACVRIPFGKGVCGTAAARDAVQVVADVHAFPGHIACDDASSSEIVIPLHRGAKVVAVLDIDSPVRGRFGPDDKSGLEECAGILEAACCWDTLQ